MSGTRTLLCFLELAAPPLASQEREEDLSKWVQQLGSDSIVEREEAMRFLESMDPKHADRIERVQTTDPEVRGRLATITKTLRVRAVLSKVLRPTKRATCVEQNQPLKAVAENLSKALGEKIVLEGLDPTHPVKINLKDATLWESLGALADAADAHYEYLDEHVVVRKGKRPPLPARALEQFLVEVIQVTRAEGWTPAERSASGMICLALTYQRDLKPSPSHFGGGFRIDSVVDANGAKVDTERRPKWGGTLMIGGTPRFGLSEQTFVPADAAMPLKVQGAVDLPFVLEEKAIEIPLAGESSKHKEGTFTFEVQGLTNTPAGLKFSLYVKGGEAQGGNPRYGDDITAHLQRDSVVVVAGNGSEAKVQYRGGSTSFFQFETGELDRPKAVKFRWNTKFHRVQFDWQLEGVRLPK